MTEANEETTNKIFNTEIPISDGSKKLEDGILEIIGHYNLKEFKEDYTDAIEKGNARKEAILEYVSGRLFQRPEYIDMVMVSTYNNFASFSVSMKNGYTLQMSIDDMNQAIRNGINPKIGKFNLETLEIE